MLRWLDTLGDKINNMCDATIEKTLNNACLLGIKIIKGIVYILVQFDEVFIIIAMLGVFFMIFGNKKIGTKITSSSILIYTVLRMVVSKC